MEKVNKIKVISVALLGIVSVFSVFFIFNKAESTLDNIAQIKIEDNLNNLTKTFIFRCSLADYLKINELDSCASLQEVPEVPISQVWLKQFLDELTSLVKSEPSYFNNKSEELEEFGLKNPKFAIKGYDKNKELKFEFAFGEINKFYDLQYVYDSSSNSIDKNQFKMGNGSLYSLATAQFDSVLESRVFHQFSKESISDLVIIDPSNKRLTLSKKDGRWLVNSSQADEPFVLGYINDLLNVKFIKVLEEAKVKNLILTYKLLVRGTNNSSKAEIKSEVMFYSFQDKDGAKKNFAIVKGVPHLFQLVVSNNALKLPREEQFLLLQTDENNLEISNIGVN